MVYDVYTGNINYEEKQRNNFHIVQNIFLSGWITGDSELEEQLQGRIAFSGEMDKVYGQ